jgi:hypothetical protein
MGKNSAARCCIIAMVSADQRLPLIAAVETSMPRLQVLFAEDLAELEDLLRQLRSCARQPAMVMVGDELPSLEPGQVLEVLCRFDVDRCVPIVVIGTIGSGQIRRYYMEGVNSYIENSCASIAFAAEYWTRVNVSPALLQPLG